MNYYDLQDDFEDDSTEDDVKYDDRGFYIADPIRGSVADRIIDRLTRAFIILDGYGYVCRHNFWCCMTCGSYAMFDENGDDVKYVFYHNQDAERLIEENEGVHLAWRGDAAVIRLALEKANLLVEHDGNDDTRFYVSI